MSFNTSALGKSLDKATRNAIYWRDVCQEIANLLGGNNAALIPENPDFRSLWLACTRNLLPAMEEYIAQGWHLNDFRQKTLPIISQRGYATDDDILDNRSVMASMPYYTDFLWKYDAGFFIGMKITTPNGIWSASVYFKHDQPPISKEQIKLIETICPLIEEATQRAEYFAHESISDFANFFKGTSSEVHVLNPHGQHCLNLGKANNNSGQNNKPGFLSKEIL